MTTEAQDEILLEQMRQKQKAENRRISRTLKPAQGFDPMAAMDTEAYVDRRREIERRQAELEAEREKRRIAEAWRNSGVGRRFLSSRLDNYETHTPEHKTALAVCRQAVGEFRAGGGVLLLGDPGGGKTHLLCGMLFEAVNRGMSVRYITAEDFYLGLRSRMDEGLSESGFIDRHSRPDVLALDDLYCLAAAKSAHDESYQYRMLWTLLDRRYRDARATIVSTNKPLKEFKEMLDERTRRRLEARMAWVTKRIPKEKSA